MNLEDILDLDTGLKYKFYHEFTEYYELSYFQKKNELNSEVEKNTLPLLEEEYSDGIGELIYNDDDGYFQIDYSYTLDDDGYPIYIYIDYVLFNSSAEQYAIQTGQQATLKLTYTNQ